MSGPHAGGRPSAASGDAGHGGGGRDSAGTPLTSIPGLGDAVRDIPDRWRELGEFIREQRAQARLSLRRLSQLAGISNPYLSQIERGMRHPSAEILQQIAKALRISAETLYVRAGILEERPAEGDLVDAVLSDGTLTDEQKRSLIHIVVAFRLENQERATDGSVSRLREPGRYPGR
jgi:transcriptional regulator with XRE-family HTH domain